MRESVRVCVCVCERECLSGCGGGKVLLVAHESFECVLNVGMAMMECYYVNINTLATNSRSLSSTHNHSGIYRVG